MADRDANIEGRLNHPSWRPPERRDGLAVEFVSEDGRQRKVFDFAMLPGRQQIREELATAFTEASGPLGSRRRLGSVNGLWTVARKATRWLATNRPGLRGLGELSVADTRLLLLSMRMPSGDAPVGYVRAFFAYCTVISDEVHQELARHPAARQCGNRLAESRLRTLLGSTLTSLGRFDDAICENLAGLRLGEHENDQFAMAAALTELAAAARGKGDLPAALDYLHRAKAIHEVAELPEH